MTRKKVGILTFHYGLNYGGVLQCYALKRVLEDIGCEAVVLDRLPLDLGKYYTCKRSLYYPLAHSGFNCFRKRELAPLSRPLRTPLQLRNELEKGYDACIVGSDQIWRKDAFNVDGDYFLMQQTDLPIRKIAYAASFGVTDWQYNEKETIKIKNALDKFDYVSVREEEAVDLLREFCLVKADWVLDPTLLANREIFDSLLEKGKADGSNKIVTYILDWNDAKLSLIGSIKKDMQLEVVHILEPGTRKQGFRKEFSVYDWIRLISSSARVITDSFHGTVFSAIYGKTVTIIPNQHRGISRFVSLLSLFDAELSENVTTKRLDFSESRQLKNKREFIINKLKDVLL